MSDKEEGLELQEVVESREINGFKEMVNASNECGRWGRYLASIWKSRKIDEGGRNHQNMGEFNNHGRR